MRKLTLGLLFASLTSVSCYSTEFSHLIGVSYQYDNPTSSQLHPTGYGLRYQLGINDKWIVNGSYVTSEASRDDTSANNRRELEEYNNQFANLGLSYQTNDYYIDMQLLQFSDEQRSAATKPKAADESSGDGFGIALGLGLYHDWDDWGLEYGATIIGSQSDLKSRSLEKANDNKQIILAESTLQQASANLGMKLSYFYVFEDWALMPTLGVGWSQMLGQDEEQERFIQRNGDQRVNLIRRGLRYPGFLAYEDSGIVDLTLDLMHYQGLNFSLGYSVGFATEYQVNAWVFETSYSF